MTTDSRTGDGNVDAGSTTAPAARVDGEFWHTRCPRTAGRCEKDAGHEGDHYTEYKEPVWSWTVGAATPSLDDLEAEIAEIVAAELFDRLMPGYGTIDAPQYAGTEYAVRVYRQHGASVARKVRARLEELQARRASASESFSGNENP